MSSNLKKSNQLFRAGLYQEAIEMYKRTLHCMPELENIIKFNIELAQKRISSISNEEAVEFNQNTCTTWTTYAMLQSENVDGQMWLGGMSIGLATKEKLIPDRVLRSINIFQLISQVKASHKLATYEYEKISQYIFKSSRNFNSDLVHKFDNRTFEFKRINYESKSNLRILIEYKNREVSNHVTILRAYQYACDNGGALFLVGENRLDEETFKKYRFSLINPYMPILMTLSSAEGVLIDASVIPYPSILDGGIHQSECAFFLKSSNGSKENFAEDLLKKHLSVIANKSTWRIGKFQVDIRGALGSELIFSKEFTQWILAIFSIRLKIWRPPELNYKLEKYWHEVFITAAQVGVNENFNNIISREKKTRSLLLPSNGIPTLALMTALENYEEIDNQQQCNFIVEDGINKSGVCRYYWPDIFLNVNRLLEIDNAVRIPLVIPDKKNENELNYSNKNCPIAILNSSSSNENLLVEMTPVSPDETINHFSKDDVSRKVKVVLTAEFENLEQFGVFIESIYVQSKVEITWLYFYMENANNLIGHEEILLHYFKNKFTIKIVSREGADDERLTSIKSDLRKLDDESYLLFVGSQLICHDKRTIYALASLLEIPKVVTASPMLIALSKSNSTTDVNIFRGITQKICNDSLQIEYSETNRHKNIPRTLIPVAAISTTIFIAKATSFRKYSNNLNNALSNVNPIKEFAVNAFNKGCIHLLTQSVSVTIPNFEVIEMNIIKLLNSKNQNSNKIVAFENLIP